MPSRADLHHAIQATLAEQRLGRPVFVRYLLHDLNDLSTWSARLAETVDVVRGWLGQTLQRTSTVGSLSSGQVAVTLQFEEGGTALVCLACGLTQNLGPDVLVLGNWGALYHEAGNDLSWDTSAAMTQEPAGVPQGTLPFGVLLVSGSHTHQEDYAAAFAADARCRLVAVTDEAEVDLERRQWNEQLAQTLGIPHEPDLARALARSDVHLVSICAPPERRGRIALRCAAAGKHLYLDKSLTPRLDEADALVARVREAGVRSHMFSFITRPWAREAKRLLSDGRLGPLLAVHAVTLFAKGSSGTARLGRSRQEEYPPQRYQLVEAKRELDNVGVYPVTLIRWLTGLEFRTVYGVTANYFFREHQEHDVEDFGLLACTLENGLPVTIVAGRCGWRSHPAAGVNRLTLVGSERTVVLDANRPRLEVYADEPPWLPPARHPADPMGFWTSTQAEVGVRPRRTWVPVGPPERSDAAYFLDCLEAGRDSEMSVAEAARATEVLLAGYRSAATGEEVTLPLPR